LGIHIPGITTILDRALAAHLIATYIAIDKIRVISFVL
jgi:hypothetical protein